MVECNLAKVEVEGSNPFSRSKPGPEMVPVFLFLPSEEKTTKGQVDLREVK